MSPHREEFVYFFNFFFFKSKKKNRIVNNLILTDANSGVTRLRADLEAFLHVFLEGTKKCIDSVLPFPCMHSFILKK